MMIKAIINKISDKMKTLEEIKDEWAKSKSYKNYAEFKRLTRKCDVDIVFIMDGVVNQITKRYATEYAKEVQNNISYEVRDLGTIFKSKELAEIILSEDNLPKHK